MKTQLQRPASTKAQCDAEDKRCEARSQSARILHGSNTIADRGRPSRSSFD